VPILFTSRWPGSFHEPGRADLLVGLDAPQRVPTEFMVLMRELGIEEAHQVEAQRVA